MELIRLTNKDAEKYLKFYRGVYRSYPKKKDDMGDFLERILEGKSPLNQRLDFVPVLVCKEQDGKKPKWSPGKNGKIPIMGAVLARCHGLPEYLQISFFEATEKNSEAFSLILKAAETLAKKWDCKTLTGGLNLHVNYGLGFLGEDTDEAGFGMNYNPLFYNDLFREAGFFQRELVTYQLEMKDYRLPLKEETRSRLTKNYYVEKTRWKKLKKTVETYTTLNNRCFTTHPYYYPRVPEEDYELFKPFTWLLRDENLLFVYRREEQSAVDEEKQGERRNRKRNKRKKEPVGFMLWYPDYNELIPEGKSVGMKTLWDLKVRKKPISKMKIVEMGVIPEERNRGAILALFQELEKHVVGKYQVLESSWVLGSNEASKAFGIRWADGEGKGYAVYERALVEGAEEFGYKEEYTGYTGYNEHTGRV